MINKFVLIFLSIVLIVIAVGCSLTSPQEPTVTPIPTVQPGKAVVSSKCIACHDLSRVTNYKSDSEGWTKTVDYMILMGAILTEEQREQTIDYLVLTFPKE